MMIILREEQSYYDNDKGHRQALLTNDLISSFCRALPSLSAPRGAALCTCKCGATDSSSARCMQATDSSMIRAQCMQATDSSMIRARCMQAMITEVRSDR